MARMGSRIGRSMVRELGIGGKLLTEHGPRVLLIFPIFFLFFNRCPRTIVWAGWGGWGDFEV